MTSTRKARPASRWLGLLSAAVVAAPGLAHARALDLVFERTVMTAADERCGLFEPEISAALDAARLQARGAALRQGATSEDVRLVEQRGVEKAAAADCASQDMAVAAQRVRSAFSAYARLQRYSYPGETSGWRADRTGLGAIRWRLAQDARIGEDRMIFGLAGRQSSGLLLAVAQFADGRTPYAARLIVRDISRTSGPYLDQIRTGSQILPLEKRLPSRSGLRIYAAEARSPAGGDLLPKGSRSGWAFRFPPQAVRDLAALDPREAVAVEFLFADDVARRAYVEVGDFAAGRAFLQLAAR